MNKSPEEPQKMGLQMSTKCPISRCVKFSQWSPCSPPFDLRPCVDLDTSLTSTLDTRTHTHTQFPCGGQLVIGKGWTACYCSCCCHIKWELKNSFLNICLHDSIFWGKGASLGAHEL